MIYCPNKSSKSWVDLVSLLNGDDTIAYAIWHRTNGNEDGLTAQEMIDRVLGTLNIPINTLHQTFNTRLDNVLLDFIKGLNITVIEEGDKILKDDSNTILKSLKGKHGSPLAAFDLLQKYLVLGSDRRGDIVPEQAANIIYTFLGKKNKLSKDIWFNINKWSKYNELYNKFAHIEEESDESDYEDYRGEGLQTEKFNSYAHKQVIIEFIKQNLIENFDKDYNVIKKRKSEDINKEYFENLGFKDDITETNPLIKIWNRLYNFIKEKVFRIGKFEKYNEDKLKDLVLDIVDDVYKKDYVKFLKGLRREGDGLVNSKGEKLELKDYDTTLQKDKRAAEIIQKLFNNPFIDYRLSGSQVLRKYGKLYRSVDEDLHDIDGVITLEQFMAEPNAFATYNWLTTEGLKLKGREFIKGFLPYLNKQNWYANVHNMFPNFKLLNAFIGKDHKHAESVTITGVIDGEFDKNGRHIEGTGYIVDFFLRTAQGNYPEIFNNYWKDWKQIFEAKINMGRSKDMGDLVYFEPFIEDKYKFTNKGFRYFTFADSTQEENYTQQISNFLSSNNIVTSKPLEELNKKYKEEALHEYNETIEEYLNRLFCKGGL